MYFDCHTALQAVTSRVIEACGGLGVVTTPVGIHWWTHLADINFFPALSRTNGVEEMIPLDKKAHTKDMRVIFCEVQCLLLFQRKEAI
jgi:hypothetical protein